MEKSNLNKSLENKPEVGIETANDLSFDSQANSIIEDTGTEVSRKLHFGNTPWKVFLELTGLTKIGNPASEIELLKEARNLECANDPECDMPDDLKKAA